MEGQFHLGIFSKNVKAEIAALEKKLVGFEFTPETDKDVGRLNAFKEVLSCLECYQSNLHKLPRL